jgi:outer membrane protein
MNQMSRLLFSVLFVGSVVGAAVAEENAATKSPQPSLLTVAPPVAVPAPQKPVEAAPVQQPTRLGHVDMARVAAESEAGKNGKAELLELKKKLQGQIDAKRKQLDKLKTSLEGSLKPLSPQQREAKAKEFQKKVDEFQKFGLNAEKQLQEKEAAFTEKLFKAIEDASAEVGKAKNLALVVIKRELLFLNSGVDAQDVTDEVIKKVDKK